MKASTSLFLAYRAYRLNPRNRLSFADYVTTMPDLAAIILVAQFRAENGIPAPVLRGRKAKAR